MGTVSHADPVETVPEDPDRHGGGAATAAEALEESVIDGAGAGQQLTGNIASLVQCLEELQKAVHCRLADGFSVRQAAHPVRHHGKHPTAGHGLRVRGVYQGKGILLPLPGTDALDVSHQKWEPGARGGGAAAWGRHPSPGGTGGKSH